MKSKLTTVTVSVTIALAGLPVHAYPTERDYREQAVSYLAMAQCIVNNGGATQEKIDEMVRKRVQTDQLRGSAFRWALTSSNGKAAVQAVIPFATPDCLKFDFPDGWMEESLYPYFK